MVFKEHPQRTNRAHPISPRLIVGVIMLITDREFYFDIFHKNLAVIQLRVPKNLVYFASVVISHTMTPRKTGTF